MPGPKGMPVFGWRGNALRFFRDPPGYMERLYEEFGPMVRLSPGHNAPLFFASPRKDISTFFAFGEGAARRLLSDTDTFQTRQPPGPKAPVYQRLATNLFFLNGERYRQQKDLMRPWFTREHLKRYHGDIVDATARMLEAWRQRETVDIGEEMKQVTLEISSKTLYGIEARGSERHLAGMMSAMISALFSPASMIPLDLPGTPFRRLVNSMKQIEERLWKEIRAKRDEGFKGHDILTSMAQVHYENPGELTEAEMVGEAFTLFFAGHDTASRGLTWTLFLLAQHPEVAEELYEELDRELGGEPPTYEQVFALPVLDRVVKESLRVLTPSVVFSRVAAETTSLGGYEIPEGCEILYSPFVLHRDPAIFEHPKRFDPDRWLDKKPGRFEYLPFGAGMRTCLGASFSMVQLRLMIAMIAQSARLELVEGSRVDLKTHAVIGPKGPMMARVSPQDQNFNYRPVTVSGEIQGVVELPN